MSLVEIDDAQIGRNIASIRESRGLSQKDLADAMRSIGFKWSQATVWNVERGERPLRATELVALEGILKVLTPDIVADDETARVRELTRQVHQAYEAIRTSTAAYDRLTFDLALVADRIENKTGFAMLSENWVNTSAEEVVREYHREQNEGYPEIPVEAWERMGKWERRYNEVRKIESEFELNEGAADGEPEATS